jgi:hypothetical protein
MYGLNMSRRPLVPGLRNAKDNKQYMNDALESQLEHRRTNTQGKSSDNVTSTNVTNNNDRKSLKKIVFYYHPTVPFCEKIISEINKNELDMFILQNIQEMKKPEFVTGVPTFVTHDNKLITGTACLQLVHELTSTVHRKPTLNDFASKHSRVKSSQLEVPLNPDLKIYDDKYDIKEGLQTMMAARK